MMFGEVPLGRLVKKLISDANGLIALHKPHEVLSHPNSSRDIRRSLIMAPYCYREEAFVIDSKMSNGNQFKIWLLHRLDSSASGIILVSDNEVIANIIKQQFRDRKVKKYYKALVFGHPPYTNMQWEDNVNVQRGTGRLRTVSGDQLHANTVARVLQKFDDYPKRSLLELAPITGRTHQLRYQCASRNFPIVGDEIYGDFKLNKIYRKIHGDKHLHLTFDHVQLRYCFNGIEYDFEYQL